MTDSLDAEIRGQRFDPAACEEATPSIATEGILDIFRKTEDKHYKESARATLEQIRKDLKVKVDTPNTKPIKLGATASYLGLQGARLSSDKIVREYAALMAVARMVFRNYNAAMTQMVDQIADGLIAPAIKGHQAGALLEWKKTNRGVHVTGMDQFFKTTMRSRHTDGACKSTAWMLSDVALIDFHAPVKGESLMTQAAVGLELRLGGKSVSSGLFTPLTKAQIEQVVELSTHFDEDFTKFSKDFEKASLAARRKLRDRLEALGDVYPDWRQRGRDDELYRIFAYGYTASHFAADGDRDMGAFFDRICLVLIVMGRYAALSLGRMTSTLPKANAATESETLELPVSAQPLTLAEEGLLDRLLKRPAKEAAPRQIHQVKRLPSGELSVGRAGRFVSLDGMALREPSELLSEFKRASTLCAEIAKELPTAYRGIAGEVARRLLAGAPGADSQGWLSYQKSAQRFSLKCLGHHLTTQASVRHLGDERYKATAPFLGAWQLIDTSEPLAQGKPAPVESTGVVFDDQSPLRHAQVADVALKPPTRAQAEQALQIVSSFEALEASFRSSFEALKASQSQVIARAMAPWVAKYPDWEDGDLSEDGVGALRTAEHALRVVQDDDGDFDAIFGYTAHAARLIKEISELTLAAYAAEGT